MGAPTVKNFKGLIRMNIIKNCPVTVKDSKIAEKIFGPDISTLKGKSVSNKPKQVTRDIVDIPKELVMKHSSLDMCIDTMFINKCVFLTSIDKMSSFVGQFRSKIKNTPNTTEHWVCYSDTTMLQVLR